MTEEISITASTDVTVAPPCSLCLREPSRYTCPRCNVRYCSAACYRCAAHARCSESFYRECVVGELRGMEGGRDEGERRRMVEILKRCARGNEEQEQLNGSCDEEEQEQLSRLCDEEEGEHDDDAESAHSDDDDDDDEEEDDDDDVYDALWKQLKEIDVSGGDVEIWKNLPEESRKTFVSMLRDGSLARLVEPWEPWWMSPPAAQPPIISVCQTEPEHGSTLCEEEEEEPDDHSSTKVPPILTNVPCIEKLLTRSRPSSAVCYGVCSALYAYAYACRLCNGEQSDTLAWEASHVVVTVMSDPAVTTATEQVGSVTATIAACVEATSGRFVSSREMSVWVVGDVVRLLRGVERRWVVAALSDCFTILNRAKSEAKSACTSGKRAAAAAAADTAGTASTAAQVNKPVRGGGEGERVGRKVNDDAGSKCSDKETREHLSSCFRLKKKLEFYVAWTLDRASCDLEDMIPELDLEFCSLTTELSQHRADQIRVDKLRSAAVNNGADTKNSMGRTHCGKTLIEEL